MRFLEQNAAFCKIKLYQDQTGGNFLSIFENVTCDPQLGKDLTVQIEECFNVLSRDCRATLIYSLFNN